MKLLDRTGYINDAYVRVGDDAIPAETLVIVPLARLEETLTHTNSAPGVEIGPATKFDDIAPYLDRVSLVSIAIGGFGDGRCYSLAKRISRSGFKGRIRVTGPLIADQFPYALACGVDEIALPDESAERQPAEQWAKAAAQMTNTYQRGYERAGNILDQRRAARKAAANG